MAADSNVKFFGTSETPDILRPVQLGPLSFLVSADGIRRICWHGAELVRAIAWPIRDENWGTYPARIAEMTVNDDGAEFEARLGFSVDDGNLDCALAISASARGEMRLDLVMTPVNGPFATNRAGFTVLHPIAGIAGAPVQVTHSGGATEQTVFPRLISPGQPVFDIQGLKYGADSATVSITFAGDVFEMEDQRNWSDASYKTYCVPLVFPFTYRIAEARTQSIHVTLSGNRLAPAGVSAEPRLTVEPGGETAPDIGLVVDSDWLSDDVIGHCGVGHVRARVGPQTRPDELARLAAATRGRELDIELVIADTADPAAAQAEMRAAFEAEGLAPERIIALREGYLSSHQPSGPWPKGPTPAEVVAEARRTFPGARIGGGVLTNFTELNRCRPDPAICDFITFGNSAIVHAADDLSVCETLEALPQIFESAAEIAGGKPIRLGLVSIGMRSNPYGAALAHNHDQVRHAMAHEDPRQRGLFAAAYAVGVLAATRGYGVEAVCLAAPVGPFGICHRKQPYAQPYFDETPGAAAYPIFHVVRAAAAMAGQRRLRLSGLPDGLHGYGAGSGLMLANTSPRPLGVDLAEPARAVILDSTSFAEAAARTDWLDTAPRHQVSRLEIESFGVAFLQQ